MSQSGSLWRRGENRGYDFTGKAYWYWVYDPFPFATCPKCSFFAQNSLWFFAAASGIEYQQAMASPVSFNEFGKPNAPILFFIHGWPDNAAMWKRQVEHFSKNYRCVVVTLPGFGKERGPAWGEDFGPLVDRLAETISVVATKGGRKTVTVVGHDWGAYLTYLLDQRYPQLVNRIITLDVGAHVQPKNFGHTVFLITYQWWLVAAFLVGKFIAPLGDWMSRRFAKKAKAPRHSDVNHRMNYLYYYFWRAKLFTKNPQSIPFRYRPSKPLLFLYGEKKKYPFHSHRWEKIVNESRGSKVVGLPKCDHWLMIRNPDLTNSLMEGWLRNQ